MKAAGEIEIRLAREQDLAAILLLDRATESLPHWPETEYRAALAGAMTEPRRCLFVADADGQIAGLAVGAVTTITGQRLAELETVGVGSSWRRRGLGEKLCKTVLEWCRAQGAGHIELEVRSRSAGPIALYRGLGFEDAGERPSYYSQPDDDAVLMRLALKGSAAG